jgi:hypothetical protein
MGEVIRLDRKQAEEAERHYYCLKCGGVHGN